MEHHYTLESTISSVLLRTDIRPPFEPKGSLVAMREAVVAALASLARPADHLYARYTSAIAELADAENVLFYNFRTSSFRGLGRQKLTFERSFQPCELGHECFYTTTPGQPLTWPTPRPMVRWQIPRPRVATSRLVAALWFEMKRAQHFVELQSPDKQLNAYGISLIVTGAPRLELVGSAKALLDGVISGMHSYEGAGLDEVSTRLSNILPADAQLIRELLLDSTHAPLGPRQLAWARMKGLQWNPADHQCVTVTIEDSEDSSTTQPGIEVTLLSVE